MVHRILAIDPGTRDMGVAVLEGDTLLYATVKVLKRGQTAEETLRCGKKLVQSIIRDFHPDTLVIEKTFFARSRNVALLNVFADAIKQLAERMGLAVRSFAPCSVKKVIAGHGHASKRAVALSVASRFPELKAYLQPDRKWKERFHANMFDAVALGLMLDVSD